MTFVPYCQELIQKDLLEENHNKQIKTYYEQIGDRVMPVLERAGDRDGAKYLEE